MAHKSSLSQCNLAKQISQMPKGVGPIPKEHETTVLKNRLNHETAYLQ